MIKKYFLYLVRWQLSTPILAIFTGGITLQSFKNSVLANFIGGLIFFWIDKYIFATRYHFPLWELKEEIKCVDCNEISTGYRIVKTDNYDKLNDKNPEFRCKSCSQKKKQELINKGVKY